MAQVRARNRAHTAKNRNMEKPTAQPPQFTPNKAQAIQVEMYENNPGDYSYTPMMYDDNQLSWIQQAKGKGNKGNKGNKGKNKGGNNNVKAVDPGAIKPCLYRYVYIWPKKRRGEPYWMYVTYIGRTSVAGWRYTGRQWVYYSTDLRSIDSFYCY